MHTRKMIVMPVAAILGLATPIFTALAADAPSAKPSPIAVAQSSGSSADSQQQARTKSIDSGRGQLPSGGLQYPFDRPE